jgi:hypothetical protein
MNGLSSPRSLTPDEVYATFTPNFEHWLKTLMRRRHHERHSVSGEALSPEAQAEAFDAIVRSFGYCAVTADAPQNEAPWLAGVDSVSPSVLEGGITGIVSANVHFIHVQGDALPTVEFAEEGYVA